MRYAIMDSKRDNYVVFRTDTLDEARWGATYASSYRIYDTDALMWVV